MVFPRLLLALILTVGLTACKDGLLEPEAFGTVQGRVLDRETNEPIVGASVTTSPATGAFVTDADGRFSAGEVLTGSYTISANRLGYDPNTVTVAVRESQTTDASFFLEQEDEGSSTEVAFAAELLNFTPEIFQAVNGSDSTYVTLEYRAINQGDVDIETYEIYFRIDTNRGPFYQEVTGSNLEATQRDIGTVRKYLIGATPSAVEIEGTSAREAVATDS
ncbi:MAG: hypothetical protein Rubg2KO_32270 [Rubricoccaceae bacterium]